MTHTALITGASGGLGEEFAKLFAKDKWNVVLVARSEDKLQALKKELENQYKITVTVIAKDLSLAKSAEEIMDELQKQKIELSALVNNAGFGAYGLFAETDFVQEEQMIHLNIEALTRLTKLIVPGMIQRKHGMILNVASTAAFVAGPLMAVYYASKAYVLNFSLALSNELKGTGITVTCLCPGPTSTGFQEHAHMAESKLFTGKMATIMSASSVALTGYNAMKQGKSLIIPGFKNKFGTFMTRFVPRMFAAAVARSAQEHI